MMIKTKAVEKKKNLKKKTKIEIRHLLQYFEILEPCVRVFLGSHRTVRAGTNPIFNV